MKYLKFLLLLIVTCASAQKVKYIDENMQAIDSFTLIKKCKQHPFKCLKYDTDTLIINKVLYKYRFGKLDRTTNTQIRNTLINDSNTSIDKNAVIIVHYYDSLSTYNTVYKNHLKHIKTEHIIILDSGETRSYYSKHKFNEKTFEKNRTKFVKKRNKWLAVSFFEY